MDLLDRLYDQLWSAAKRGGSDPGRRAFTVAEVYQQLIPYRTVRVDLGILELAQYEHALLRLLSGERGYAELELPEVREEVRRELASTNPILGIYRDYAAVGMRLRPAAGRPSAGPIPPGGGRVAGAEEHEPPTARTVAAPPAASPAMSPPGSPAAGVAAAPRSAPGSGPAAPGRDVSTTPPAPAPRRAVPLQCRGCRSPLPARDDLRFCPYCGHVQAPAACARCALPLHADWRFCIRCGTRRVATAEPAPRRE